MVSVVILSAQPYKENRVLCDSLVRQTYKDFEVLVASEKGIVNAMNKALDRAKGDIFVRIDDDVMIGPDWLRWIVYSFKDPDVGGVTGPTFVPPEYRGNRDSIRMAEKPNWFLRWMFDGDPYAPAKIYKCGSVSYGSNYFEKFQKNKDHKIDHLEGTNWAMRTNLIRRVGGFDPLFNGVAEWYDTDVEQKIKKLGYKLVYNTRACLWHMLRQGKSFEKRYNGFGRIKNWLRFHWRHSKFHPKMLIWLLMFGGYAICQKFQSLFRR